MYIIVVCHYVPSSCPYILFYQFCSYNASFSLIYIVFIMYIFQTHVKDIVEGTVFKTYKKWVMAMTSPDKECDMAGFISLRIMIGVSKPSNP